MSHKHIMSLIYVVNTVKRVQTFYNSNFKKKAKHFFVRYWPLFTLWWNCIILCYLSMTKRLRGGVM